MFQEFGGRVTFKLTNFDTELVAILIPKAKISFGITYIVGNKVFYRGF